MVGADGIGHRHCRSERERSGRSEIQWQQNNHAALHQELRLATYRLTSFFNIDIRITHPCILYSFFFSTKVGPVLTPVWRKCCFLTASIKTQLWFSTARESSCSFTENASVSKTFRLFLCLIHKFPAENYRRQNLDVISSTFSISDHPLCEAFNPWLYAAVQILAALGLNCFQLRLNFYIVIYFYVSWTHHRISRVQWRYHYPVKNKSLQTKNE